MSTVSFGKINVSCILILEHSCPYVCPPPLNRIPIYFLYFICFLGIINPPLHSSIVIWCCCSTLPNVCLFYFPKSENICHQQISWSLYWSCPLWLQFLFQLHVSSLLHIIIITKLTRNHPAGAPPFPWQSPWNGCKVFPEYDPLESPTIILKYNIISCIYLK